MLAAAGARGFAAGFKAALYHVAQGVFGVAQHSFRTDLQG